MYRKSLYKQENGVLERITISVDAGTDPGQYVVFTQHYVQPPGEVVATSEDTFSPPESVGDMISNAAFAEAIKHARAQTARVQTVGFEFGFPKGGENA